MKTSEKLKYAESTKLIDRFKHIKSLSDQRRYDEKMKLLRELILERPQEFVIDSEENDILGITHTPTGFRWHLPKSGYPQKLRNTKMAKFIVKQGQKLPNPMSPEDLLFHTATNVMDRADVPYSYLKNLSNRIAQHESGNRNIRQKPRGPGRGYYQFEEPESLQTAAKRLFNIFPQSTNNPTINDVYRGKIGDATKLSRPEQTALFYANLQQHPNTRLGTNSTSYTVLENWIRGHKAKNITPEDINRWKSYSDSNDLKDYPSKNKISELLNKYR